MVFATFSITAVESRPSSADIGRSMIDRLASVRLYCVMRLPGPALPRPRPRLAQRAGNAIQLVGVRRSPPRRLVQLARDARPLLEDHAKACADLAGAAGPTPADATTAASTADGNHDASTHEARQVNTMLAAGPAPRRQRRPTANSCGPAAGCCSQSHASCRPGPNRGRGPRGGTGPCSARAY